MCRLHTSIVSNRTNLNTSYFVDFSLTNSTGMNVAKASEANRANRTMALAIGIYVGILTYLVDRKPIADKFCW